MIETSYVNHLRSLETRAGFLFVRQESITSSLLAVYQTVEALQKSLAAKNVIKGNAYQ